MFSNSNSRLLVVSSFRPVLIFSVELLNRSAFTRTEALDFEVRFVAKKAKQKQCVAFALFVCLFRLKRELERRGGGGKKAKRRKQRANGKNAKI